VPACGSAAIRRSNRGLLLEPVQNQFFARGAFASFNEDLAINATEPPPSAIIREEETSGAGSGSSSSFVFRRGGGGSSGDETGPGVGKLDSSNGSGGAEQGDGVAGEGLVQRWNGPADTTHTSPAPTTAARVDDTGSANDAASGSAGLEATTDDLPQVYRMMP
jgi:hypothetical protein